jgi:glycosyltransferase involved in cell wall biosynthesis
MQKVTAIIPTFNEEVNIKEAIESVLWADEVIVVDSFSTDKTQEIVKSFPQVKLLIHEYENSAAQKNWTIPQAQNDWIFLLDADERPTPKLVNEIKDILKHGTDISAFWIKRKNTFMEKELNFTWKSDQVIRLFRKSNSRYEDKHVHAEVITEGKIGSLKHKLTHDTYKGKGLEFHLKKGDRYTTWSAYDHAKKVKKVTLYHLMLRPAFAFFKHYIVKGGFLDGKQGFIISILTTWNVFIRFVKVWRIQEGEKIVKR